LLLSRKREIVVQRAIRLAGVAVAARSSQHREAERERGSKGFTNHHASRRINIDVAEHMPCKQPMVRCFTPMSAFDREKNFLAIARCDF